MCACHIHTCGYAYVCNRKEWYNNYLHGLSYIWYRVVLDTHRPRCVSSKTIEVEDAEDNGRDVYVCVCVCVCDAYRFKNISSTIILCLCLYRARRSAYACIHARAYEHVSSMYIMYIIVYIAYHCNGIPGPVERTLHRGGTAGGNQIQVSWQHTYTKHWAYWYRDLSRFTRALKGTIEVSNGLPGAPPLVFQSRRAPMPCAPDMTGMFPPNHGISKKHTKRWRPKQVTA